MWGKFLIAGMLHLIAHVVHSERLKTDKHSEESIKTMGIVVIVFLALIGFMWTYIAYKTKSDDAPAIPVGFALFVLFYILDVVGVGKMKSAFATHEGNIVFHVVLAFFDLIVFGALVKSVLMRRA